MALPPNYSESVCCVCLSNTLKLVSISLTDANDVSLFTKLKICVWEIDWLISYEICEPCIKLLDISYSFRDTCLKSEIAREAKHFFPRCSDNVCDSENTLLILNANNQEAKEDTNEIKHKIEKEDVAEDYVYKEQLDRENFKNETSDEDDGCEAHSDDDPDYVILTTDVEEKPEIIECKPARRKRKKMIFKCDKCSNTYNSSIKLVNHCVKDHQMKKIDIRPFSCDRCSSRFCKSSNLLQHIKYHEAVRSNMCTYCGKSFITKTDLNIHEKQHLNKREYKCDECEKCFNTHKDIRSHKLVVHTDSKCWKYCCEICNKPFPIKSNYDSHMRRHTGIKKFECHLCQRKFTEKCVLQRHMRTHTNVREYKCSYCDREYKDPRVLKVHMAKVHGIGLGQIKIPSREKKYICHICPKSYYAKNKLTRHLYTHSGEKPYDCTICGKKFSDKSYVKQHLRKTHNTDEGNSLHSDNSSILIKNESQLLIGIAQS